jgi:hypothetical protein
MDISSHRVKESVAMCFLLSSFIVQWMAGILADNSALKIVFCGRTLFFIFGWFQITDSFFLFGTVQLDFGMVFVFYFQYAGRFLAETFVAGTTSDFA